MDKAPPVTVPLEPAHSEPADLVSLATEAVRAYSAAEEAIADDDPAHALIASEHRLRKRLASRLVSRGEEPFAEAHSDEGLIEHWWAALKRLVSDPVIKALEHCEEADGALIKGLRQHLVSGVGDEALGRVLEAEFERLKTHLSRLTQERAFKMLENEPATR